MRGGNTTFQPYGSGRRAAAAIVVLFTLYTGVGLLLSARTSARSSNRAEVQRVADRQRTLAERYEKAVLLERVGAASDAAVVARALEQSVQALLHGGTAPGLPGDDDGLRINGVRTPSIRLQLLQEQRLIADLVRTGDAYRARRPLPTRYAANERFAASLSAVDRISALTGLTSNVALNVGTSIGSESDRRVAALISLERWLAGAGFAVFGLLSWALVASTRRRSAHFRSLVASTTDLVLVFVEGRCRYVSTSVLRLLGVEDHAVLGDGIAGFVHVDDRNALRDAVTRAETSTLSFRLPHATLGWRELEANVTDLRDDRHVRGVVLNARDVTERNRADAERERLLQQERLANDRLRELDRLKDEFVALVSHEVRTPLTSIRGYLELLTDENLTDGQRSFTDIIGRNSERLLRLIDDLLVIAQIEGGHLTVERDHVDLGPIVADAIAAAAPTAAAGEVELVVSVEPRLPLVGDAVRLAQLLDNLLSNAIKFTAAGGTVAVAAGRDGESVWLEVRDNGIGIEESDQELLFNKFFRTRAATQASIQGTGLGLAISKAIVHAHGGTIAVHSSEGSGATFRVELPVGDRAASPAVA